MRKTYQYAYKAMNRRNRVDVIYTMADSKGSAIAIIRRMNPEVLQAGKCWLCYELSEGDPKPELEKWLPILK